MGWKCFNLDGPGSKRRLQDFLKSSKFYIECLSLFIRLAKSCGASFDLYE